MTTTMATAMHAAVATTMTAAVMPAAAVMAAVPTTMTVSVLNKDMA